MACEVGPVLNERGSIGSASSEVKTRARRYLAPPPIARWNGAPTSRRGRSCPRVDAAWTPFRRPATRAQRFAAGTGVAQRSTVATGIPLEPSLHVLTPIPPQTPSAQRGRPPTGPSPGLLRGVAGP